MSLLGRDASGEGHGHDISIEERRSRLERKAEVIRSRLLRHVDALDARRHHVTDVANRAKDVASRAKDAAPAMLGVVLAAGALVGVGVGLVGWALRARRRRLLSYRISAAIAPFRRPERPPFFAELGRKLLVGVVTVVVNEIAKRGARVALEGGAPVAPRVMG